MPSSYTTNLRLEAQLTGENINTWGIRLDNTLGRIDDAIAGYVAIALTGSYTLQSANDNTTADEARRAHLKFTGTLTLGATITLPSVSKSYWVWNASGQTLTFSTGSGATTTVENGDVLPLWCDGTNVKSITYGGYNLKDYIATMTATAGAVPGVVGHAGKFLYTDGSGVLWRQPATTDLSDYTTRVLGVQVALAVSL